MRKGFFPLIAVLPLCLLLSGCYDSVEINERAYPIAMAVDRIDEGTIELGLQFIQVVQGSQGGEDIGDDNIIVKIKAQNVFEAYQALDNRINKQLSAAQLKVLILDEALAREGIYTLINAMNNSYKGFANMYVLITPVGAIQYLEEQKIWQETTPAKFYELLERKNRDSFFEIKAISEISMLANSHVHELVLPYMDYMDPELENPSKAEMNKLAVFKDGALIDVIEEEDINAYGLLRGNFAYAFLPVPTQNGDVLDLIIQNRTKPKFEVTDRNGNPHIEADITVDIIKMHSFNAPQYRYDLEKLRSVTGEHVRRITSAFLGKCINEYDSDVFALGRTMKKRFNTIGEFDEYRFTDKFKNSTFNINVNVNALFDQTELGGDE